MKRSLLALALASALAAGCSQGAPKQDTASQQPPAPAAAPAPPPANAQPAPPPSPAAAPPPSATPASPPAAASPAAPAPPPDSNAGSAPKPSSAAEATTGHAPEPPVAVAPPPPPPPPPPPEPKFREVTVPAGTTLSVTLVTPVASNTSKVEDTVSGTIAKAVVVGGRTAVPKGADISGTVIEANESGRVKGRASIALQFDRLVVHDEGHPIQTSRVRMEASPDKKDDVKKGGIGAGVGAIVGGIAGGGTGAAIGAGVGGAGTLLATKGKEVNLPAGTALTTTLQQSIKVLVPNTAPKPKPAPED